MRVVVIGAGAVGRSLIGKIFCNAGYHVVFIDKQMEIVHRLSVNAYYPVREGRRLEWVGPISAQIANSCAAQIELRSADVILCSVRVENLEDAASQIVEIITERPWNLARLDIIIVENLPNAAKSFQSQVEKIAREKSKNIELSGVHYWQGIAECVIPEVDPDVQLLDPALVNGDPQGYLLLPIELAKILGSSSEEIRYTSNFDLTWAMKWFCHCAFHAVLAYVGLARGMKYIDEVADDQELHPEIDSLCTKIATALAHRISVSLSVVRYRLYQVEWYQMRTPSIRDTCARVARDPARKVAPGERLRDLEALIGEHSLLAEAIQQAERMARK